MDVIDQIKSRLSIEEVVSRYVQLKKSGSSFKALCPFHKEKTPSFIVSPQKQLAYCFGCHKGGDIFKFIQEIESVDFPEALQVLAEQAHIELSPGDFTKSLEIKEKKGILYSLIEKTVQFYEDMLWNAESGIPVLEYLKKRGIADESIKKFRLGYAPSARNQLLEYLLKQGFSESQIKELGLVIESSWQDSMIIDRFRHRLMFPIWNYQGQPCAFTGRVIADADEPKYMNSPESVLYNKGELIYGFYQAKEAVIHEKKVIVVEGNMDVIASHQSGIMYCVASSGTAMTTAQLSHLKRYASSICIAFDNDVAGKDAVKRVIPLAQNLQIDLKIISTTSAKDAAEIIQKDPHTWQECVNNAESYFDYCFNEMQNSDSDEKNAVNEMLLLIKSVKDAVEKDQYLKKIASYYQLKPQLLYDSLNSMRLMSYKTEIYTKDLSSVSAVSLEEYFFGLLFENPTFFSLVSANMSENLFSEQNRHIYRAVIYYVQQNGRFKSEDVLELLEATARERMKLCMLYVESKNNDRNSLLEKKELLKSLDRLLYLKYCSSRTDLLKKIYRAKLEGNSETVERLFKEYSDFVTRSSNQSSSYGKDPQIYNASIRRQD